VKAKLSLVTLALVASFLAAPTPSEAQNVRRVTINQQQGWFTPPGSSVRIYPAPRYGYHVGNTWIYPARPWNPWNTWNGWYYGAPSGYRWLYGYSPNFSWR